MSRQLPKWWQVYSTDAEKRVLVGKHGATGLVRDKSIWHTVEDIVADSGNTRDQVETILAKYGKMGMIVQGGDGDYSYTTLYAYYEKLPRSDNVADL